MMLLCICWPASGKAFPESEVRDTVRGNLYLKFNIDVRKRNILLKAIPRLYSIADGQRYYVGETYCRYDYDKWRRKFNYHELLRIGTIKHQSTVFPNLLNYVTPHLYDETIINDYVLSPFCEKNRRFYRYTTLPIGDVVYVRFRPRIRNSTLTSGTALIKRNTNTIIDASFKGEYDMIDYELNVIMDTVKLMPVRCYLRSDFNFLGNDVRTSLYARYDCQDTLPETITDKNNPELMAQVRRDTLKAREIEEYEKEYPTKDKEVCDTTDTVASPRRTALQRMGHTFERMGSVIYDYFIRRLGVYGPNKELSMTPILDPLAIDYSGHRGVSYRVRLWANWDIDWNRLLRMEPRIGYSFKQRQLYINVPLRYTFNRRRDGWAELYLANGNHITNSLLTEKIKNINRRDTIDFSALNLEYYRNYEMSLRSNIPIGEWFHIGLAAVYHRRSAINMEKMRELGEKTVYHTFAPSLTLKYTPSSYVSYVFNYERSLPHVLGCDSKYERMELDAQFAVRYNRLTSLNLHLGAGMYTDMESNDFVDYANFSANYLPLAWNDDWTGHFFLLKSDFYNASKYYIRSNLSYESPILPLAYIPFVGYYVEKERIYISNVLMQKTRPYTEMGYAFTTRYFSAGLFASFFGTEFKEIGTKITLELFNRW